MSKFRAQFIFLLIWAGISVPAFAAIENIPLNTKSKWEVLKYSKIKSNEVSFSKEGMVIDVKGSASPLIFPLNPSLSVEEVHFSAKIEGDIKVVKKQQGEKGIDDFVLRIGLVHEGDETLNFFKRRLAAQWVVRLFDLAPKGTGIKNIEFYNVYSDERLKNTNRVHPHSDLIKENFVFERPENGELNAKFKPNTPSKVLALWISSDGDDTGAAFKVIIKDLKIITKSKEPVPEQK